LPFDRELAAAEEAARRAGRVILAHYTAAATPFETKADGSPVSRADLEAEAALLESLRAAFPDDAILSEESPESGEERLGRERVWIVDPLDGTRGFLARTGDFGVHVALAVAGVPTVAIVYQPVEDRLYRAVAGRGAFAMKGPTSRRLRVSTRDQVAALRVGISRHNAPAALTDWLAAEGLAAVAMGASSKYTALAEGTLDALVTITTSEMEWDTCAPELIVHEAGGTVTDGDGQPLRYNQPAGALARRRGIVASNGRCHAELLERVRPLLTPGASS
jgi:3'(2'), 5'-bisphosphate nucleotidase